MVVRDLEEVLAQRETGEALPRLAATTAREILSVLRGERPNRLANPEVWNDRRRAGG